MRKHLLTAFFYSLLGTFILKKKHIQIFQQASIMHSLIQPADDILDKSTWNIQTYRDILKFFIE